ncbi:ATP-binding protein [Streptomyces sp. NPDC047000]|uniref:ATP-binding protein n=1 Tax=Streptomyces sp. NPDC047000 TaxID=3155474 RepID=UPI0033D74644
MDPNNAGPEAYGDGGDGDALAAGRRTPRESLTTDFGASAPALARTARLVTGEYLLTVNPVDGSEIEVCPPAQRPARPEKRTPDERAETERAARPPVPPGPLQAALPLLERQEDREQLVRLLARGRSVRLVGAPGSGRTRLLDLVAEDCADLAPQGVVRLSGFRRTTDDVLHDLFHAVHRAPLYRPERDELLELVREIGAVVVLDDAAFGGAQLEELLDATPECAFLIATTPEAPAPAADSDVADVVLTGLDRAASVRLLEAAAGRSLTEEEEHWAGDLWFESEGLPLRFVQAGALLRQRDRLRASTHAVEEFGVFQDVPPADVPAEAPDGAVDDGEQIPLPSVGEAAGPAALLASRLGLSARAALRFAVALGGELPHQAHLPALVGDTHADAALGELAGCGLVTAVGSRYRLTTGAVAQLAAAGYADDLGAGARTAAEHYTWWAGHPSVTPERVCAEADAVLAALAVLVPPAAPEPAGPFDTGAPFETAEPPAPAAEIDEAQAALALRLARTAAPAFAAGLDWNAWEQTLRAGAEAARLTDAVSDQAYFRHELGVLALCLGEMDRARAELEASIRLHAALAEKRGTVAGRRALALVADRTGTALGLAALIGEEFDDGYGDERALPPGAVRAALPPGSNDATATLIAYDATKPPAGGGVRRPVRRNLVAAGSGAVLVALLGTVVTLGMTSHDSADNPSDQVGVNPSISVGLDDGDLGAVTPKKAGKGDTGKATSRPTDPGPDGTYGTSDDPTPPAVVPAPDPTGTRRSGAASRTPSSPSKTTKPSSPKPSPSKPSPSTSRSTPPSTGPTPSESGSASPSTSASASGPTSSAPAVTTSSAVTPSDSTSPPLI